MREEGLSSVLIEILNQRENILNNYTERISEHRSRLKSEMKAEKLPFRERVAGNLMVVYTVADLVAEQLKLPLELSQVWTICKNKVASISEQIGNTDSLSTFWEVFQYLFERDMAKNGENFEVLTVENVKIQHGRKDSEVVKFSEPTKVLYFSLSKIHPMYMKEHRLIHSETGLRSNDLQNYFKNHKGFIGSVKHHRFGGSGSATTAWAFKFDEIPVTLGQFQQPETTTAANAEPTKPEPTQTSITENGWQEVDEF